MDDLVKNGNRGCFFWKRTPLISATRDDRLPQRLVTLTRSGKCGISTPPNDQTRDSLLSRNARVMARLAAAWTPVPVPFVRSLSKKKKQAPRYVLFSAFPVRFVGPKVRELAGFRKECGRVPTAVWRSSGERLFLFFEFRGNRLLWLDLLFLPLSSDGGFPKASGRWLFSRFSDDKILPL